MSAMPYLMIGLGLMAAGWPFWAAWLTSAAVVLATYTVVEVAALAREHDHANDDAQRRPQAIRTHRRPTPATERRQRLARARISRAH